MKIIVAGCGKVGATIIEELCDEGHDISVIDTDPAILEEIAIKRDVLGVIGSAASYEVQQEAGVSDADLLIAVTDSDEINMLCCLIAKKAGNCRTIARVRNPLYHKEIKYIKDELGLSLVINPELSTALEISRIIRIPTAINVETFARGRLEMVEFIVPDDSPLVGMPVIDIRRKLHSNVLLCAIDRDGEVFIPNGGFVIQAKDIVHFVSGPNDSREFFRLIGIESYQKIKKVMIIGGGKMTYYLSRQLIGSGIQVKIIEKDRERCEELSARIPEATIINADANNREALLEEGLGECDAFVSATGMDEANIFLSLMATEYNENCKIITKVNNRDLEDMVGRMNLGSTVSTKYITAESMVRYVRAMQNGMGSNMETLYRIVHDKAEAMEFVVAEDSPLQNIPIIELPIKKHVLLAAIYRRGDIIYPNGQTELKRGDRVVVVTTIKGLNDLKDILDEP